MAKRLTILYITIFFTALILPTLATIFGLTSQGQTSEWRVLAKFPKIGEEITIKDYPQAFDAFMNDNFGFRPSFLKSYGNIKLKIFNTNPVQTDLVGKDGWFYHNPILPPEYKPFYDHIEFKEEELATLKKRLIIERNWLRSKNIDYILIIIPDKEVVYSEFFPFPGYQIFDIRLNQFLSYMKNNTDLKIIYLKDTLKKVKAQTSLPLYYKGDTHWTNLGAYFGYRDVMKTFSKTYPEVYIPSEADFNIALEGTHEGDLMRLNSDSQKIPEKVSVNLKKEVNIKKLNKVYVYGDSFSVNINGPVPEGLNYFLKMSFEKVESNHYTQPLNYQEIEVTKPELVIRESIQRYIYDWTNGSTASPPVSLQGRRLE